MAGFFSLQISKSVMTLTALYGVAKTAAVKDPALLRRVGSAARAISLTEEGGFLRLDGEARRVLSSSNPIPKLIRNQYEEILLGNGTPRIDPITGQQKVFRATELKQTTNGGRNVWDGSLEWDVPGTKHRILQRPDGRMGYVVEHDYSKPKLFPEPWYPDGGKL